jgi:arylsulfatase A-like enzyme
MLKSRTERAGDSRLVTASLGQLVVLGLWFGLMTGFVEVGLWLARSATGQPGLEIRIYGRDFSWLSPSANAIIFVGVATALHLFRRFGRPVHLWEATLAFTALAFFGPLFTFHPRLHKASAALLALGAAAAAARAVRRHPARLQALARRTLPLLCAGLVTAVGIARVPPLLAERRAMSALPPARSTPNVILIVLDTVAASHMSLHGYNRPTTPRLQSLGARGVVFERAFSPTSWTLPSHASLFTGRQPKELSADWQSPLDGTSPTLAEILASQGYATAGFVANVAYVSRAHGLNRGFAHYEDHVVSMGQLVESAALARFVTDSQLVRRTIGLYDMLGRKTAPALNRSVRDWIAANRGRPFFVFVNYFDAHSPFVPPEPYASAWRVDWALKPTHPQLLLDWSAPQVAAERNSYDAALAFLDDEVGRLLDALQTNGAFRNTLVIVTSDHGEEFYEHGIVGHGENLYLKTLHVPLLLTWPDRLPAGQRVMTPVSLSDVPATVLDVIGVDAPTHSRLAGRSLRRLWRESAPQQRYAAEPLTSQFIWGELSYAPNRPDRFPVSKGDMRSLIWESLHFIRRGDGEEELFDIDSDPDEQRNRVGEPALQGVLQTMRDETRARESQLKAAPRRRPR